MLRVFALREFALLLPFIGPCCYYDPRVEPSFSYLRSSLGEVEQLGPVHHPVLSKRYLVAAFILRSIRVRALLVTPVMLADAQLKQAIQQVHAPPNLLVIPNPMRQLWENWQPRP